MGRALVLDQEGGDRTAEVRELSDDVLPAKGVLLDVQYSSLNYKDALAVTGRGKIIRGDYPFVPGIDLVGEVAASDAPAFAPGDRVIGTGGWLGEKYWGGFAERQRVPADFLVKLPVDLTPKAAMIIGTAGFTAMLAVMALEEHGVTLDDGEVIVTGASGGAGSVAVALLARLGYGVVASTGSTEAHDYLHALGAGRIIDRQVLSEGPARPLESAQWAGAVDAIGGRTPATLISRTARHGAIAAFGNAGGHELHTSVYPFILRGVRLLGIDSNTCPLERRRRAWRRLADVLSDDDLDRMTAREISLEEIPAAAAEVLSGGTRGRVIVDVRA